MASFTNNADFIRNEFKHLKIIFENCRMLLQANGLESNSCFKTLSMGMSSDYHIAIEEGATMVRIGSLLFGERIKN